MYSTCVFCLCGSNGGPEMNQTDLLYACLIIYFLITAPKNRFLFVLEQRHCGSGLLLNGELLPVKEGKE